MKKISKKEYNHFWIKYLPRNFKPQKILDIGTEYESYLDSLADELKIDKHNVLGLNVEGNHYKDSDVGKDRIKVYDGFNIPYPDESFDIVTCIMVLHHIKGKNNIKKLLREIVRVIKKGGYFVVKDHNIKIR